MIKGIDESKRNFVKCVGATAVTLVSAGLPEILLADENDMDVYSAPRIRDIEGKKNYCARYSFVVSRYKFDKHFEWTNAWNCADHNYSVQKINNMRKNDFNMFISDFVEEGILKPGMLVGTFYKNSSWNYKFYNKKGKAIWKEGNDYYKNNGKIWVKANLNKDEIDKLKPINYTHLLCYAGKGINNEPIFWQQFPYPKKDVFGNVVRNEKTGKIEKEVLQKSIRLGDLEKNHLFIKEIIDVPRKAA